MRSIALACLIGALTTTVSVADDEKPETPKQFAGLKYRAVGPAAGGRTSRAIGVPGAHVAHRRVIEIAIVERALEQQRGGGVRDAGAGSGACAGRCHRRNMLPTLNTVARNVRITTGESGLTGPGV